MARNHLANCSSPYLQQHADNPVEWYPWGDEALNRAKAENKPILLSIGYSACHWCHVMAHESFEDSATAQVMNQNFINIKVDREERPDLDKVYQQAHQLLTQQPGGWPLTVFLTPEDQAPFFAGTYFPDKPRQGMMDFTTLMGQIAGAYQEQAKEIGSQNEALLRAIRQLDPIGPAKHTVLDPIPLDTARQQLARAFDATYGGFGEAPKFPHTTDLERLLRHWLAAGQSDARALHMVDFTLQRMSQGGIFDQLGGGFFRYSVDEQWQIPHFEKMLYDNGPLLALYCDIGQITRNPEHEQTALATADWVISEMQSPLGGFYATLDADSTGGEGSYYTWAQEELETLLSEEALEALTQYYQLTGTPNFEARWHLHHNDAETAGIDYEQLGIARQQLFEARTQHAYPGRDNKILTAWNALMIKGLARSGRVLKQPQYIDAAAQAVDFIHNHLWRDGRLLASHINGESSILAYLDDYAFLLDALLELLQARWDAGLLAFTQQLAETLLEQFEDPEYGGFFFSSKEHESLIYRPKTFEDGSVPSGNGIAATAFNRLGHLLGESRYITAAERTLNCAIEQVKHMPHGHCSMLMTLEEQLYSPETIVIRGSQPELSEWHAAASVHYAPRRICIAIADDETELAGLLAQPSVTGKTVAYICKGGQCLAAIETLDAFKTALSEGQASPEVGADQKFEGPVTSFKRHRE